MGDKYETEISGKDTEAFISAEELALFDNEPELQGAEPNLQGRLKNLLDTAENDGDLLKALIRSRTQSITQIDDPEILKMLIFGSFEPVGGMKSTFQSIKLSLGELNQGSVDILDGKIDSHERHDRHYNLEEILRNKGFKSPDFNSMLQEIDKLILRKQTIEALEEIKAERSFSKDENLHISVEDFTGWLLEQKDNYPRLAGVLSSRKN